MSRIHRLPHALLTEVLHIVGCRKQSDLITITHVCRAWRSIALDSAKLWTTISFYDQNRADEFLRRSKNHAIDVKITGHAVLIILKKVAPHFHRIRSLTIRVFQASTMQTVLRRLRGSAPLLRRLSLTVYRTEARPITRPLGYTEVSPFGGETPSLRSMSLGGVISLSLSSPAYKSLIHLYLKDLHHPLPLPEPLLAVLAQCPRLQVLYIHFKVQMDTITVAARRDEMIVLPDLRELKFSRWPSVAVSSVLANLCLPGPAKIKLSSMISAQEQDDPYLILPQDCSAIRSLCNFQILEFFASSGSTVDTRAYADANAPFAEPCVSVKLAGVVPALAMRHLPSVLNLSTIETFVLSYPNLSSSLHVNAILGSMINMRTLRMVNTSQETVNQILLALPNPYRVGPVSDPREVLCPHLDSLEIVGGRFTLPMKYALMRCVEKYSAIGCPIQTVDLMEVAGWELPEIEHLKAIVSEVYVNE